MEVTANMIPEAPNTTPKKIRTTYSLLDAWRGVAVLWVLMIHACLSTIATKSPELADHPLYAFSLWGQLGVTLFFVISGYCICAAASNTLRKGKDWKFFIGARVRRIYPPYYASSFLIVVTSLFYEYLASFGIVPKPNHSPQFLNKSITYYFSSLTLTQLPFKVEPLSIIYWSLCYEVSFYAVVSLLIFTLGRWPKRFFYNGIQIITIFSLICLIVSPKNCPFPFDMWYSFGLGTSLFIVLDNPESKYYKISFLTNIALAFLYASVHPGTHEMGHPSNRSQTLCAIVFSAFLWASHRFDERIMKFRIIIFFTWLGTISYSVYLSHLVFISPVNQLAMRMGMKGDKFWISFLLQIFFALGGGYIFHIFFERPFISQRAKSREKHVDKLMIH